MTKPEREAFLAERRKGIGASDVAALFGMSKWKTALEVWADKCGLLDDGPQSEEQEWGLIHEQNIADAFTKRTGIELVRPDRIYTSDEYPIIRSNLDFVGAGSPVFMDAKTTGRSSYINNSGNTQRWGLEGTDEVPDEILFQIQTQYACVPPGFQGYVGCLIGGNNFRTYSIPRSQGLIEKIVYKCEEFWDRFVKARVEPDPDWTHRSTADLIKRMADPEKGSTFEVEDAADPLVHTVEDYVFLSKCEKMVTAMKDTAKAKVIHLSGGAETVTFPGGQWTYKKQSRRDKCCLNCKTVVTPGSTFPVARPKLPDYQPDVSFVLDKLPRGYGGGSNEDEEYAE